MTERRRVRIGIVTIVATAGALAAGCSSDEPTAATVEPCRAVIDEAAVAAEIDEQIELLDTALVICRSADAFTAHVERHPGLIAWDVATYLTSRCTSPDGTDTAADDAVKESTICTSDDVAPPTTQRVEVPQVVYVGETLDGREVEIRPRAGRPFTGNTPTVIAEMADLATVAGCEGVEEEFERWNAQVDDPLIGDEASVYAQHARNVLAYIQCDTDG